MRKPILFVMIFAVLIMSMFASADVGTAYLDEDQENETIIPETTTTTIIEEPQPFCRDSDNGFNYYIKGNADNRDKDGIGAYYEDKCLFRFEESQNNGAYKEVESCSGFACNLQEAYCNGAEVT